jgi:hypothetical protein
MKKTYTNFAPYFFILILSCTLLLQGGFYPLVQILSTGFVSLGFLLCRSIRIPIFKTMMFLFLCISYLLSSYLHSGSIRGEALLPFCCFIFWLCLQSFDLSSIQKTLQGFIPFCAYLTLFLMLSYSGLFDIPGNFSAGRLQITLQYANSAGILFAALCFVLRDPRWQSQNKYLPLFQSALFLTQSIGAISLYLIALLIWIYPMKNSSKNESLQLMGSILIAASILASSAIPILSLIPLLILGGYTFFFSHKITPPNLRHHRFIAMVFLVSCIVIFLLSSRGATPIETYIERLIQIQDASLTILKNPILGIGPGEWARLKPLYQSAQYDALWVHSSFFQAGVDAGLGSLLLLIALCFAPIWKMVRQKKGCPPLCIAICIIIVHTLMDFNFSFFILDMLLILLITLLRDPNASEKHVLHIQNVGRLALAGVTFMTISLLVVLEWQSDEIQTLYAQSSPMEILSLSSQEKPKDPRLYELYIQSLIRTNQLDQALLESKSLDHMSKSTVVILSKALSSNSDPKSTLDVLLYGIEKNPFEPELYALARYEIANLPPKEKEHYLATYNQAVDRLVQKTSFLSRWLKNQQHIPKMK